MKSKVYLLIFALFSHLSSAETLTTVLLEKTQNFYKNYAALQTHKIAALEKSELTLLSTNDYEFLKSRLKIYGLAPFEVIRTQLKISLGAKESPLEINYESLDLSVISIQGIPYTLNLNQDLKKLYEVDYKKALKRHKTQTSFWPNLFFPLTLSGCVDTSGKAVESAVNSSSIPLAYLKLCAECVSLALQPEGAVWGTATALTKGIKAGIKQKSYKACGIEFCKNLPGIRRFVDVYNAHNKNPQHVMEHSK